MKDILNNQWIVTILGGLVLAGLTTGISQLWSSRKSRKDIEKCRGEILSVLENIITNDTELTPDLLRTIVSSITRKNDIPIRKFYSDSELIEDTLVRLYSIDYISIDDKNKIVKLTLSLRNKLLQNEKENPRYNSVNEEKESIKEIIRGSVYSTVKNLDVFIPVYLFSLSVLIILTFIVENMDSSYQLSEVFYSKGDEKYIILILPMLIGLITLATSLLSIIERRRRKNEEEAYKNLISKKIKAKIDVES